MVNYCSLPLEGDVHAYILNLKYNCKINFKISSVNFFKNLITNHDIMISNSELLLFTVIKTK